MPPTRGHDLKPQQGALRSCGRRDAPHTGARLETGRGCFCVEIFQDAPHTGARLETYWHRHHNATPGDAPHTGARLETTASPNCGGMTDDAPHTGARLETFVGYAFSDYFDLMPPTRGHDLKHHTA